MNGLSVSITVEDNSLESADWLKSPIPCPNDSMDASPCPKPDIWYPPYCPRILEDNRPLLELGVLGESDSTSISNTLAAKG